MKKHRVCIYCESWESGGIESFLHNVLCHSDFSNIEIDIVTASLHESVFTQDLQDRNIQFFQLSGRQRNVLKNYLCFCKLLKHRRYDVIHLNVFQGMTLFYLYLAKRAHIPVRIAHSHNSSLRKSPTQKLKLAIHDIYKCKFTSSATDLWACSSVAAIFGFSKKQIEQKGVQFIPNGIKIDRFRFNSTIRDIVRSELGLTDKFVIGNIGRLCYQKNQSYLLDVFVEVVARKSNSYLLLVGDGDQKSQLEQKAKRLGISQAVLFYGVTTHVEQLLWAMDILIFPSLFEGLGIAAVEAQAAGLPVICSEYIPNEALITPLIKKLSISEEAKVWADEILKAEGNIRGDWTKELQIAGFEIADVAQFIKVHYLR